MRGIVTILSYYLLLLKHETKKVQLHFLTSWAKFITANSRIRSGPGIGQYSTLEKSAKYPGQKNAERADALVG